MLIVQDKRKKVEVIYLDSVIADGGDRTGEYGASEGADTFGKDYSDMTVDEIKDLYKELIKTSLWTLSHKV